MGEASKIEWTHSTWNPWRGCDKVDPTCAYCYMFRDQRRYGRDPSIVTRCGRPVFNAPLSPAWARRREECLEKHGQHLVFTCSWSDWFHESADPWRPEAWEIIRQTPGSTFQILTSRPDRILEHLPPDWGDGWPNVWMGVTIGNRRFVDRADLLRAVPAAVRFISAEPLLGPLDDTVPCPLCAGAGCCDCARGIVRGPRALDLTDIGWVIAGGESGGPLHRRLVDARNRPRLERAGWVRSLRDACVNCPPCARAGADLSCGTQRGPAFFFKQWGGPTPTSGGRLLDGRTWDELPTHVAVPA
jgi:protein gp37